MASHGKNSAAYYRQRRAVQRVERGHTGQPLRIYGDYTQTPAALARGAELRRLEQLPIALPTDWVTVRRHRL